MLLSDSAIITWKMVMFMWIDIVDVEHWEICERCKWLNTVLILIEYILIRNDISNYFTMAVMAK